MLKITQSSKKYYRLCQALFNNFKRGDEIIHIRNNKVIGYVTLGNDNSDIDLTRYDGLDSLETLVVLDSYGCKRVISS